MKYELIALRKSDTIDGNIALIKRGGECQEYAVVRNLDINCDMEKNCWDWTIAYYSPELNCSSDIVCLQKAIECFRIKTEENYISRCRLEELATKFKDWAIDNQNSYYEDEAKEVIVSECELSNYEAEFFGLKESED